jgi:hypothetical protein
MRSLIFFLILTFVNNIFATCKDLETAEKLLDPKTLMKTYEENVAKHLPEPAVHLQDYQQARNYAFNHPIFDHLGFGKVSGNSISGWHPYKSRMEASKWNNQIIGWEKKLPDGGSARIRVDFTPNDIKNPKAGGRAHINMEFLKIPKNGHKENFKLAVDFECPGRVVCTEGDILKIINGYTH